MVNFGLLTAEIDWRVSGTPANFKGVSRLGFVTAPTLLNGRQPNFARCLAVSWAGTLYIHILGALAPSQNFAGCKIHFASKSCVRLYWQRYCTALQQRASDKVCGVVQGMELRNFRRRRHLYSAGRPSRWASAHILVNYFNYCHFVYATCTWLTFVIYCTSPVKCQ